MHLYVRLDQFSSCRFFLSLQYRKQNKDLIETKRRIMEIANYVDKVCQAWCISLVQRFCWLFRLHVCFLNAKIHRCLYYNYIWLNKSLDHVPNCLFWSDQFYRDLNIRVPLIGLEVWTEHDQCIINEEPNSTLWSFLQWRQKLKSRKKHDNAQLLTLVTIHTNPMHIFKTRL